MRKNWSLLSLLLMLWVFAPNAAVAQGGMLKNLSRASFYAARAATMQSKRIQQQNQRILPPNTHTLPMVTSKYHPRTYTRSQFVLEGNSLTSSKSPAYQRQKPHLKKQGKTVRRKYRNGRRHRH